MNNFDHRYEHDGDLPQETREREFATVVARIRTYLAALTVGDDTALFFGIWNNGHVSVSTGCGDEDGMKQLLLDAERRMDNPPLTQRPHACECPAAHHGVRYTRDGPIVEKCLGQAGEFACHDCGAALCRACVPGPVDGRLILCTVCLKVIEDKKAADEAWERAHRRRYHS